jgi:hypothetical protein
MRSLVGTADPRDHCCVSADAAANRDPVHHGHADPHCNGDLDSHPVADTDPDGNATACNRYTGGPDGCNRRWHTGGGDGSAGRDHGRHSRGPGTDYDILATLPRGDYVVAVARNAASNWFMIPLPDDPLQTGWVSWSDYATLVGDTQALPIQAVDPAIIARVRNCTFSRIVIREPKEIFIPGQGSPNENTIRINPGYYKIYNADVKSHPLVFKGEIKEGDLIKITSTVDENGTPEKFVCPGG